MEAKTEKSLELHLHKQKNSPNILCKLNIPSNLASTTFDTSASQMLIILDTSGSMDDAVPRYITAIIPAVLNNLFGNTKYTVKLITFDNHCSVYEGNAEAIAGFDEIEANGCTYMAPALEKVHDIISKANDNVKKYRILSISDGALHDQSETVTKSEELKELIRSRNLTVNSQAIRLKTSGEPDTRGLSSMVQLSTAGKQDLKDIEFYSASNEEMISVISSMFENDGICTSILLKSLDDSKVLRAEPWLDLKESVVIFPGENFFWLHAKDLSDQQIKEMVQNKLSIDIGNSKAKITCVFKEDINMDNYRALIQGKIDFYFKKLKILKVVNNPKSLEEMESIVQFFSNLEDSLYLGLEDKDMSDELRLVERTQHIKLLIKKRKTSVANLMSAIKNDDKVAQLNSKQQAEYLRNLDVNDKTGKSLAKRAVAAGTDFDGTVRKELEQIYKHIHELDDIKGDSLTVSFYSTCNTLDGIKAACQLYEDAVKDDILDSVTADDVLKLINIVGVGALGEIGDYPDPMTYTIKKIYPGSFISVSDIIVANVVSHGEALSEIGNKAHEINTCVPVFEDEKILKFLMAHSPKLLEYTASVGMRRVVADVPHTFEYAILAGIWKLVAVILSDKKEVVIKNFVCMTRNYIVVAGKHPKNILDLIDAQKEPDKEGRSLYLANNGITNLISPLLHNMQKNKGAEAEEMIQRIVRAAYQFEVYKHARRLIKKQNIAVKEYLKDLLGLEERFNTVPTPLFEGNLEEPKFCENYNVNKEMLNDFYKQIYWADFIVVTPMLLKAALADDYVEAFKKLDVTKVTEDIYREKTGITFSSESFRLFNVVQSMLFRDQASRADEENKKMKIIDLGDFNRADRLIRDYIKSEYKAKYDLELKEKAKKEKETLSKELVSLLTDAKEYAEFKKLLNEGQTKGVVTHKLEDMYSEGTKDFLENLLKTDINVPLRNEKIFVIITGKDFKTHEAAWNKGNRLINGKFISSAKKICDNKIWELIIEHGFKKGKHCYRENHNRHGHNNLKPSFWAMGFVNVEQMKSKVSKEEFEDYVKEHQNCCGFYKGKYIAMKRKDRKRGELDVDEVKDVNKKKRKKDKEGDKNYN